MGEIRKHQPAKLIVGFIYQETKALNEAIDLLEKRVGTIDFVSQELEFSHTTYYEKEFGKNLKRNFVTFHKLIPPENLTKIKLITNKIEKKFSHRGARSINIDPGYLDLSKLILASTKDYMHRIYLGKGIYAEVTLFYQNKTFQAWEWTYPDYKTQEYINIFNSIRDRYARQIKTA